MIRRGRNVWIRCGRNVTLLYTSAIRTDNKLVFGCIYQLLSLLPLGFYLQYYTGCASELDTWLAYNGQPVDRDSQ